MNTIAQYLLFKGYKKAQDTDTYRKCNANIVIEVTLDKIGLILVVRDIENNKYASSSISREHVDFYNSSIINVFKYELVKALYELNSTQKYEVR